MANQHTTRKAKAAALEAAQTAADAGGSNEDQVDAARAAAIAAGGTADHADQALAEGAPAPAPTAPTADDAALAAAQAAADAAEAARQDALERARIANEEADALERQAAERLAAAQAALATAAPGAIVPAPAGVFDPWALDPDAQELADDVTLEEVLATLPDIEPGNDNEEPMRQPAHVLVRLAATPESAPGAPFAVTAKQWRTDLSRDGRYQLVEGNPLDGTTREYQQQHATRTAGRRRRGVPAAITPS